MNINMERNMKEAFEIIREYELEYLKEHEDYELGSLESIKNINDINVKYNATNNINEKEVPIIIAKNLVEIKYLLKEIRLILKNEK